MPRIIEPIRPQAPDQVPSLLTIARSEGLNAAYDIDPDRGWMAGVSFADIDGATAVGWRSECYYDDDAVLPSGTPADENDPNDPDIAYPDEKPAAQTVPWATFRPWLFNTSLGCDMALPAERYDEWAAQVLEAQTARQISRELWTGYFTAGHSLMRDAVVLAETAAHPVEVMGAILDAVGTAGTWHIPQALEPRLRNLGLVTYQGAVPIGPGGWPISFGPGYPRAVGPVSSPWRVDTREAAGYSGAAHSSPAPAATEAYIVGHSGRVEAAWRDVNVGQMIGEASLYRHVRTNSAEAFRERAAIFRYNPSRVYAGLVDTSVT